MWLLDEPTAALDPIAEADIYSRFREMTDQKGALYISHRLSSCRFCDTIAVFHDGRLVQEGNHEELLFSGKRPVCPAVAGPGSMVPIKET